MSYIKLSEYAKRNDISYRTAWNWFKQGLIKEETKKTMSGSILVKVDDSMIKNNYGVILYARTSSSANKKLIELQTERLINYAASKGYKIKSIVKEFGSGMNDRRPKLSKILEEGKYDKIIVENKDRLTRFGFNWIQLLTGNRIEVINESKEADEDITKDLISIIHSFSARIYGLRKSKNLKNLIKKDIQKIQKES